MGRFKKIAIIGVGLIGGSIGLAAKKHGAAKKVVGIFRRRSTLNKALKRKAVDYATLNLRDGVRGADLIILATPVVSIPRIAEELIRCADRGAIITDAGSTKEWLVSKIDNLALRRRDIFFVGSHPMAGSEMTGVEFSRPDLFDRASCIVTRSARTNAEALAKVKAFWRSLGARVAEMSPREHDKAVSFISHLPHIVAFGLAGCVPKESLQYAAEGFKDTTRIASSDPELWADIFLTNRKEVLEALVKFVKECKGFADILTRGDYAKLVKKLSASKAKRDALAKYARRG